MYFYTFLVTRILFSGICRRNEENIYSRTMYLGGPVNTTTPTTTAASTTNNNDNNKLHSFSSFLHKDTKSFADQIIKQTITE